MAEQLGEDFFDAEEVAVSELKEGHFVYVQDYDGSYEILQVVGFGEDKVVNGRNVKGVPFVNKYGKNESGYTDYSQNPNNYIWTETIRICR